MKRHCEVTLLNKLMLCVGSSKQRATFNSALLQKIFETQEFITDDTIFVSIEELSKISSTQIYIYIYILCI